MGARGPESGLGAVVLALKLELLLLLLLLELVLMLLLFMVAYVALPLGGAVFFLARQASEQ